MRVVFFLLLVAASREAASSQWRPEAASKIAGIVKRRSLDYSGGAGKPDTNSAPWGLSVATGFGRRGILGRARRGRAAAARARRSASARARRAARGETNVQEELSKKANANGAPTLQEAVKQVEGTFEQRFYTGEVLIDGKGTDLEEVGACLLDKAQAIVTKDAAGATVSELRLDIAACCAPAGDDQTSCINELSVAYHSLGEVDETCNRIVCPYCMLEKRRCIAKKGSLAAIDLINAAEKRIDVGTRLTPRLRTFIEKCKPSPFKCIMIVNSQGH